MRIGRGSRPPDLPGRGDFAPGALEIIVTRPDPADTQPPRRSRMFVYGSAALVGAVALTAILWPSSTTSSHAPATTTAAPTTTATAPTTSSDLAPRGQLAMTAYRFTSFFSDHVLTDAFAYDPKRDATARPIDEPYLTPSRSYLTRGEPGLGSAVITADAIIPTQGIPPNPRPVDGTPITVAQTDGLDVSSTNQPDTISWVDRTSGIAVTAQGLDLPRSTLIALAGSVRVRRQGDGSADLRFASLPAGWEVADTRSFAPAEAGWTLAYTNLATFRTDITITGGAHLLGAADVVEAEMERQAPAKAININGRQGWQIAAPTPRVTPDELTTTLIFEMTGGMTVRIDAATSPDRTVAMAEQLAPILPDEWPNLELSPTPSGPASPADRSYTTFALTANPLDGGAPAMAYVFPSGLVCLDLEGDNFFSSCGTPGSQSSAVVTASGQTASGNVRTAGLVTARVNRVRIIPDIGPTIEVEPQFTVNAALLQAFVADTPAPAHWADMELLDARGQVLDRIPHTNTGARIPVAGPPALSDPSWKPTTIVQGYAPATLTEPQVLVRQAAYTDGTRDECVLFSMPSTTTSTDYNDCGKRPLPTAVDRPAVWVAVSNSRPVIMAVLPPGAAHAEIVYPFSNVVDLPVWAGATREYVAFTGVAGRYPLELRFRGADGAIMATAGLGPAQNFFAYGGHS